MCTLPLVFAGETRWSPGTAPMPRSFSSGRVRTGSDSPSVPMSYGLKESIGARGGDREGRGVARI